MNTTAERSSSNYAERCRAAVQTAADDLRRRIEARLDEVGSATRRIDVSNPLPPPPEATALAALVSSFGLSNFEASLLAWSAGVEFDSELAQLTRRLGGGENATPTFGLALGLLPGAHWSALSPFGPLRYWRLLSIPPSGALVEAPLRIDEPVLHYLCGLPFSDDRLQAWITPIPAPSELHPQREALARRGAAVFAHGPEQPALIQLCGPRAGARRIAARSFAIAGLAAYRLADADLPAVCEERKSLALLWMRQCVLGRAGLILERSGQDERLLRFLSSAPGPVILLTTEPMDADGLRSIVFEVPPISVEEQSERFARALGPLATDLNGQIGRIALHFQLDEETIDAAAAEVALRTDSGDFTHEALWSICRTRCRPTLGGLAQRIQTAATWKDLVLPPARLRTLRTIVAQVRHRHTVHETWGFARLNRRGLGLAALFHGPSGTGKTLAAEVLANELGLDLYRIDLSAVVSKYIGETEKNLARIFDAAERASVILLFDEADALFGKRSEVKDSHDRYANLEVSYLLQRMESYGGLAILTTNLKSALDTAFLRRLRFMVAFPFPDAALRAEIWRRVIPRETPVAALDFRRLAQLNLAGGHIRNIALNAGFLAAEAGSALTMAHLLEAARGEYEKLEKPLSETEVRGWVHPPP
ncbi:MAG: ATP-binding protein [Puniceicoccaceae bacterium]|nr:MAG: ATP-binding protein [Puniceicoccaceae bacterium]